MNLFIKRLTLRDAGNHMPSMFIYSKIQVALILAYLITIVACSRVTYWILVIGSYHYLPLTLSVIMSCVIYLMATVMGMVGPNKPPKKKNDFD